MPIVNQDHILWDKFIDYCHIVMKRKKKKISNKIKPELLKDAFDKYKNWHYNTKNLHKWFIYYNPNKVNANINTKERHNTLYWEAVTKKNNWQKKIDEKRAQLDNKIEELIIKNDLLKKSIFKRIFIKLKKLFVNIFTANKKNITTKNTNTKKIKKQKPHNKQDNLINKNWNEKIKTINYEYTEQTSVPTKNTTIKYR